LSAWPALPPLSVGELAPRFTAGSPANPKFHFSTLPGRYVLLAFLPNDPGARAAMVAAAEPWLGLFSDDRLVLFRVVRDAETIATAQNATGLRWFFDPDGEINRLYGALGADGAERPFWLLLDPMLRVLDQAAPDEGQAFFERVSRLPNPDLHAGAPLSAPVAVIPRVLDPEICRRLIDTYEAEGGQRSGVMRDIGGKTVGVLDGMKSRRDVTIADDELRQMILRRISRRLAPEIKRVFNFDPTRVERHIVAC
jgi:hypothetical protein